MKPVPAGASSTATDVGGQNEPGFFPGNRFSGPLGHVETRTLWEGGPRPRRVLCLLWSFPSFLCGLRTDKAQAALQEVLSFGRSGFFSGEVTISKFRELWSSGKKKKTDYCCCCCCYGKSKSIFPMAEFPEKEKFSVSCIHCAYWCLLSQKECLTAWIALSFLFSNYCHRKESYTTVLW